MVREKQKKQDISKLAHVAFDKDKAVRGFSEQVEDYIRGDMLSSDQFLVSKNCHELGLSEVSDLPLLMKQSVIRKVVDDHEIPLENLKMLPNWLRNHPLALESLEDIDSVVIVADAKDKNARDIIIAVHLEKEFRKVTVNSITSIYGKKSLSYLVENTFKAQKQVFVNERTGDWLRRTGVPFPERITNRLWALLSQNEMKKTSVERRREVKSLICVETGELFANAVRASKVVGATPAMVLNAAKTGEEVAGLHFAPALPSVWGAPKAAAARRMVENHEHLKGKVYAPHPSQLVRKGNIYSASVGRVSVSVTEHGPNQFSAECTVNGDWNDKHTDFSEKITKLAFGHTLNDAYGNVIDLVNNTLRARCETEVAIARPKEKSDPQTEKNKPRQEVTKAREGAIFHDATTKRH